MRADPPTPQASLGITQHLISSGIARLEEVRGADGTLENAYVRVDREKVLKEGRDAVGKLLVNIQVRKSTADGPGAREYYTQLTTPFAGWEGELRDLVLRKKLVSSCFFFACPDLPVPSQSADLRISSPDA